MAARAIGTSTISFGLVSLPVKLYSTGESGRRITFNWINKETGSRVKQQYIDPQSGTVVSRDEMVKGYEFAKNQYVTFTPDELKALEAQSTESIDITEFVPAEDIERIYLDKAYYLGPDKGGARAYRLLATALRETGKVAIAKYAARGKMYLVMIRPMEDGLIMEQLLYPEELRSFEEVPREEGDVQEAELNLAIQLIEQASSEEFQPDQYRDEVRERVLGLIEKKVEGEHITMAPAEEPETKIIDLMEALKASLDGEASRKPPARAAKSESESGAKKSRRKKASSA